MFKYFKSLFNNKIFNIFAISVVSIDSLYYNFINYHDIPLFIFVFKLIFDIVILVPIFLLLCKILCYIGDYVSNKLKKLK